MNRKLRSLRVFWHFDTTFMTLMYFVLPNSHKSIKTKIKSIFYKIFIKTYKFKYINGTPKTKKKQM